MTSREFRKAIEAGVTLQNTPAELLKQLPDEAFRQTGTVSPVKDPGDYVVPEDCILNFQELIINKHLPPQLRKTMQRTVKVERDKLLTELRGNRKKHEEALKKATEDWKRSAVIELDEETDRLQNEFDKQVDKVSAGIAKFEPGTYPVTSLHVGGSLVSDPPDSYLQAYDKAIKFFEWETEDIVELSPEEAEKYLLDEWSWKRDFTTKSLQYAEAARKIS